MLDPKTNSNRRQSSTFMETLQDKLKDIKNFSNWSAKEQMVAVTAVGVIFGALLPVVAVALPVAATGAAVALTLFFAVKAVEYGYKGLKWSAEKTVEGAKHTAGKIKAGAVYVKDSVKEAASSLEQATREGTSSALKKIGEGVQNLGRKMSERGASISDLDSIPYSTEPQEPQDVVLLAKRKLDPDLIDSNRDLERGSLQSNSLSRRSSMSSLVSNSTDGSTKVLLNPKEHKKAPTSAEDKVVSWFRRNKAPKEAKEATEVKYQPLSEPYAMPSAEMGNSIFYVAPQKPPRSNSPSHVSTDDSTPSKPPKRQSVADRIKANGQQQSPATVDPTRLRRNSSSSSLPVLTTAVLPKAPESPTSSRDSGINSPNPSGSSTPPKLFKPPVPPKPLAVNLAEANKRKKQQTPSTSRSNSPDSGRGSSGPSTPTERNPILDDKEFKEKLEKRRASVDQPSVEPVNPGVMYNK